MDPFFGSSQGSGNQAVAMQAGDFTGAINVYTEARELEGLGRRTVLLKLTPHKHPPSGLR